MKTPLRRIRQIFSAVLLETREAGSDRPYEEKAEKAWYARFYRVPQNRWPRSISASICMTPFCLLALTLPLNAQTAHAGATVPVGSGFADPHGVAVDASGNGFVADTYNNAVKEIVSANGVVSSSSTVNTVGSGFSYPAYPTGVAVDASGNVFVADFGNGTVKEIVAVNGVVSSDSSVNTVGSGFSSPAGVAVDGSGNVFVADYGNSTVKEIVAVNGAVSSNSTVITVGSGFNGPNGVAVDRSGKVFVADSGHNAVKEIVAVNGAVSSSSTVITVSSGFNDPNGVAVDASGNVFVADSGNNAIKEIVAVNGAVSSSSTVNTVGSGFNGPNGVAVDRSGNVFVADSGHNAVKEIVAVNGAVSSSSTVITVGSGFAEPNGVAVDGNGNVFVADYGNSAVKEIVAVNGVVSSSSPVNTLGSGFSFPTAVAVDASGNVFVGDSGHNAVKEIVTGAQKFPATAVGSTSAALTIYFTFDSTGSLAATPYVVLTQGAQNLDFKADPTQASDACLSGHSYNAGDICTVDVTFRPTKPYQRIGAVQLMGSGGTPIATFNLRGTGTGPQVIFPSNSAVSTLGSGFTYPNGVAVDGSGDVFVAVSFNNAVKEIVAVNGVVSSSSTVNTVGSGFSNPSGLAVDGSGNVYVAVSFNNAVKEIVAVNGVVSSSSTVKTLGSGFINPTGVAVDANGNVFVADSNNSAVKEIVGVNGVVSSSSTVNTVGGGFSNPYGVAVDGSGNIFVADSGNTAVKEIVAVNGAVSSSSAVITLGSGFLEPQGVAVDDSGNVFVADYGYTAVKEIDRSDPPSLSFASTSVGWTSSDSPQSILVENSGNEQLTAISPALTIGANFKQVPGSGTPEDCTATFSLAPDASCNMSISFTPTASGPLSSTAVLADNALNANPATQTTHLSGTGIALTQTITFNPIPNQVQGTTLALNATAGSGLSVSYTSLTPSVCTVAATTAALANPGTCTIVASQNGDTRYAAAAPVSQSFTVISAANFTITATPPAEVVYRERLGAVVLKLQSVNGFNANVSLRCSGGPSGTKCADLPQTVHVNGTAYALSGVLFPANTTPGTYVITFTGVSGSLSNSTNARFTVK